MVYSLKGVRMLNDRLAQLEAKRLVKEFKKSHEKGEFRNKLGRIWWPVWNRIVVPVVAVSAIMTGSAAAIATGALIWAAAHPFTKGFSVNVQNIAIKNARLFGRRMKAQNVSEEVRKQAVLEYLNQSGALFFNRAYVKKHPEDIRRMADGLAGSDINNLVALTEYNLTRRGNYYEKQGKSIPFKDRLQIYQQSYTAYKTRKQLDNSMLAQLHRRDSR